LLRAAGGRRFDKVHAPLREGLPRLLTLGAAVELIADLADHGSERGRQALGEYGARPGATVAEPEEAKVALLAMLSDVPLAWRAAAEAWAAGRPGVLGGTPMPPHLVAQAEALLLGRLGWAQEAAAATLMLREVSAKSLLALIMVPADRQRAALHAACVRDALMGEGAVPPTDEQAAAALTALRRCLVRVASLPIARHRREVFARVLLHAYAYPGGTHTSGFVEPCRCGLPRQGGARRHHFFACAPAAGVCDEVLRHLPGVALGMPHFWLLQTPRGMGEGVWWVVATAALHAMHVGRAALCPGDGAGGGAWGRATADELAAACEAARLAFRSGLQAFADIGRPPKGLGPLPPDGPFLRKGAGGRLFVVDVPVGAIG